MKPATCSSSQSEERSEKSCLELAVPQTCVFNYSDAGHLCEVTRAPVSMAGVGDALQTALPGIADLAEVTKHANVWGELVEHFWCQVQQHSDRK